jgi:hypothetical protein
VKSIWIKDFVLRLCPNSNFPSRKQFSQDILPRLVEKTSQQHVFLALANCFSIIISFDLWMSKRAYDAFALVINFLGNDW